MDDIARQGGLGLRAQIALALLGVLALAGTLALVAIRPLSAASTQASRRQAGVTLARAVAGQVALLPVDADLAPLLANTVGPAGLAGACVLAADGTVRARAGIFHAGLPSAPFVDRVATTQDAVSVVVGLPAGGAFVAEVSLAQTPGERALLVGVVLYSAVASGAALWAVFVVLTRVIVRPVEALTRAAERVAAGHRETHAEPRGAREVVRAVRAFNAMTADLAARERDLSTRVDELERATRELRAAQTHLVRSERLAVVGRLAAGIAHEVGNPLAAIVGLTDVVTEGGLTEEETKDFAQRIGKEAQRIHRTVRELLDYARAAPEGTEAPTTRPEGDVAEAIAQVVRLLGPQKSTRHVTLTHEVTAPLGTVGVATDQLVQVLLNLLLNAADATRADGAKATVTVSARRVGTVVRIDVDDDGPGIDPAARAQVFEPFYTTKPAGEGTGLGLAICAVIVEQGGGTIEARERDDGARGARMRIELPVVRDG